MRPNALLLLLIVLILGACESKPEVITYPVELGPSCAGAKELLNFNGLYRSKALTCGSYYCWEFIRFYEDCTYKSASSFNENPRPGFITTTDNMTEGAYSIEGTNLTMIQKSCQFYGQIVGDKLNLVRYNPSSEKVMSSPHTLINYDEDQ